MRAHPKLARPAFTTRIVRKLLSHTSSAESGKLDIRLARFNAVTAASLGSVVIAQASGDLVTPCIAYDGVNQDYLVAWSDLTAGTGNAPSLGAARERRHRGEPREQLRAIQRLRAPHTASPCGLLQRQCALGGDLADATYGGRPAWTWNWGASPVAKTLQR